MPRRTTRATVANSQAVQMSALDITGGHTELHAESVSANKDQIASQLIKSSRGQGSDGIHAVWTIQATEHNHI